MEIKEQFSCENDVSIYKGDCLDLLKEIPDNYCDLIITSPPYCMGKAYEDIHDDIDTFIEQQKVIFEDIYRVLKTGGSYAGKLVIMLRNQKQYHWIIMYIKYLEKAVKNMRIG